MRKNTRKKRADSGFWVMGVDVYKKHSQTYHMFGGVKLIFTSDFLQMIFTMMEQTSRN